MSLVNADDLAAMGAKPKPKKKKTGHGVGDGGANSSTYKRKPEAWVPPPTYPYNLIPGRDLYAPVIPPRPIIEPAEPRQHQPQSSRPSHPKPEKQEPRKPAEPRPDREVVHSSLRARKKANYKDELNDNEFEEDESGDGERISAVPKNAPNPFPDVQALIYAGAKKEKDRMRAKMAAEGFIFPEIPVR